MDSIQTACLPACLPAYTAHLSRWRNPPRSTRFASPLIRVSKYGWSTSIYNPPLSCDFLDSFRADESELRHRLQKLDFSGPRIEFVVWPYIAHEERERERGGGGGMHGTLLLLPPRTTDGSRQIKIYSSLARSRAGRGRPRCHVKGK